jgi:transposase
MSASTGKDEATRQPGPEQAIQKTEVVMGQEPIVFVGVDWASTEHQVCLLDSKAAVQKAFAHDAVGLGAMVDWLTGQAGDPEQIAVAIETPHGPVVEALMDRGIAVFAINPKQLDRFRDRFSPAGAKDDRRDALVLASSLRTDRHCFRRIDALDPKIVELREWSRMADELKEEHRRLSNRIRQQLWRYYPQAIELGDDHGADSFLDLWALAPTPSAARRLTVKRVAKLLAAHRIRRLTPEGVIEILQRPALTVAAGTVEAATAHIAGAAERVRLVNRQLKTVNRRLDALIAAFEAPTGEESPQGQSLEQRDAAILRSLPGVGRTVLATLLAEANQALRSRDYHALRTLCGVAPVTKRSGKSRRVEMRQACSHRLREALYHWARVATQHDLVSKARYAALRSRGHSHGRALRGVSDRLLAVACAMLKAGTLFKSELGHVAVAPQQAA